MIIDTHAHYDDEAFDTDREALLTSMYDGGIEKIVNVCASVGGFQDTVKLMEKYPFVYGAVGIHPDDADKMTQETLDEIRRLSHMDKMVAIGEIGLDYTGIRKKRNIRSRRKCFALSLTLPEKRSFRYDPQQRSCRGYSEYRQRIYAGWYVWRYHSLFFIQQGDCVRISENGTVSGNRRSCHF